MPNIGFDFVPLAFDTLDTNSKRRLTTLKLHALVSHDTAVGTVVQQGLELLIVEPVSSMTQGMALARLIAIAAW